MPKQKKTLIIPHLKWYEFDSKLDLERYLREKGFDTTKSYTLTASTINRQVVVAQKI